MALGLGVVGYFAVLALNVQYMQVIQAEGAIYMVPGLGRVLRDTLQIML